MPLPLWGPLGEGTARCPRVAAHGQGCTGGHVGGLWWTTDLSHGLPNASILLSHRAAFSVARIPSMLRIHRSSNKTSWSHPARQQPFKKQISRAKPRLRSKKSDLSTLTPILSARTKLILPNCRRQRAAVTKVEQWWQGTAVLLPSLGARLFVLRLLKHNARLGSLLPLEEESLL